MNVAVEMLMWCVVCRLQQRLAVEAMHYAQHALFMVLSPGIRDSQKWLAIGLGRLMAECYYCRNMRAAAFMCQGTCIKVCESLDKGNEQGDHGQMLRACKFERVHESHMMFEKMQMWRASLEAAAPELELHDDWRHGLPLFEEVICVVEQVKLGGTTQFYSNLNDMMYTYAMRKWRVLLGNAGRIFHLQYDSARALTLLVSAYEISKQLQSVSMKLYDVMYIADCMKHAGRVQDACRWYTKFFTLAGGLDQALLTQELHNKPDWAAAVVLGYAEVCCLMWLEKHLDVDLQQTAQARFHSLSNVNSAGYASVKQAMQLVCQLQKSHDLEDKVKSLSSRLRLQLEDLHDKFLKHKYKAWQSRAKAPHLQIFHTWKSNAKAMRLLGEEAGACVALQKKKKKNKQKKQSCASAAGALEADVLQADVLQAPEELGAPPAVAVPEKARDSGAAQDVVLVEHHDARDAADECCVCMDAPKHFMFAPCGHRCACETCAHDVMSTTKECPMCRAAAVHIFKVFL
jgi:hypothetical protein